MKPNAITTANFQSLPLSNKWEGFKHQREETSFSFQEFSVPQTMIKEEVQPPAYVWDRILSVLDEQDKKKELSKVHSKIAPHIIKLNNRRKAILYAAIFMLLGAVILSIV